MPNTGRKTVKKTTSAREARLSPVAPRPHQKDALKAIRKAIKAGASRGKVIMPTGSGKTLVALWAAMEHGRHILVLVPSLALIRQIHQDWTRPEIENNARKARWLAVCSDPSVVRENKDEYEAELAELKKVLHGYTTNDIQETSQFLSQETRQRTVVVATYHSAHIVAKAMPKGFKFDLGVFDEAHKTAGREGKPFAYALDDEKLPVKTRLFFTATPRITRYRREVVTSNGHAVVLQSMHDEEVYGKDLFKMSFKSAVDQGLIVDYEVLIPVMSYERLREKFEILKQAAEAKGEGVPLDLTRALGERNTRDLLVRDLRDPETGELESMPACLAKTLITLEAAEKFGIKKLFSFHESNVASAVARAFYEKHNPEFKAFQVSGKQSALEREIVLADFKKSKRALVTNARCLGEGVNVPAVDAVAFLVPRRSRVDVIQAVGRACRKSPGKKKAYVILPIILEPGESLEKACQSSSFGDAAATLDALRSSNDVLNDYVTATKERILKHLPPLEPDERKIKFLIDETLQKGIFGATADEFVESLEMHMAGELSDRESWTKEKAFETVKGLTPNEAKRGKGLVGRAYLYLSAHKLLQEAPFDRSASQEVWTKEKAFKLINGMSPKEAQKKHPRACAYIYGNGLHKQAPFDRTNARSAWSKEKAFHAVEGLGPNEARRNKSRVIRGAYHYLCANELLDEAPFKREFRSRWTRAEAFEFVRDRRPSEVKKSSYGVYGFLLRNNLLDKAPFRRTKKGKK